MSNPESQPADPIRPLQFIGLLLLSLATLLLELALTRVLSVSLWYHFGFLVISTALLGFGASGVTLALWTRLRERANLARSLAACSLCFASSTLLSFWLMQQIPFDPFSIAVDRRQFLFMPIYLVVVALPFFCSGLGISLLLTRGARDVTRLYAFDLVGAGLGCGLITLVLPRFGGSGSVVFAAFIGALAALCFSLPLWKVLAVRSSVAAILLLALSFHASRLLPIHVSANKQKSPIVPIYEAWNTLSLVQVVETPGAKSEPGSRRLIIDAGTAATGMQDLRPGVRTVLQQHPEEIDDDSDIVYIGKPAARVLIIGSGAGSQILEALKQKAASITAVEINPTTNDIVSNRMNDYWGGLFRQPEVHLVTDEGRSFLRRSHEKYDAIISVQTISNAAVASGALSLAENYVFTREAFDDYLDHLTPDGILFFTRPESQISRLLSTARESFAARNMGPVANHMFAFTNGAPNVRSGGRASLAAVFLLQRSEIRPSQLQQIRQIEKDDGGSGFKLKVLYSPDEASVDSSSLYNEIVAAPDLQAVYDHSDSQLAPATDDKPFFNQHMRWSRIRWRTIVDLFSQAKPGDARLSLEDRPIAEVTLLVLLVQSLLIAAVCILLPLMVFHRQTEWEQRPLLWLAYFAALGLGYIMVEIALLQRFLLFLGQPIYTYAVILAGLLIFSGVGSWIAGRMNQTHALSRSVVVALVVVVITALITPPIFQFFLGYALGIRIAISLLLVAPLGLALGMPFPLGLRLASAQTTSIGAWAWGVNGFFTVIGTVLALILGMIFGFRIVLLLSALCYAGALLVAGWQAKASTQTPLTERVNA
jgi:spermidine synthase